MTLTDNTLIFYCHSEFYKSSHYKSIRYNDPLFKFDLSWYYKELKNDMSAGHAECVAILQEYFDGDIKNLDTSKLDS